MGNLRFLHGDRQFPILNGCQQVFFRSRLMVQDPVSHCILQQGLDGTF